MTLYNNYLYNETTDTFYILIYKLGFGSYSNVWFSLEFENLYSKIKNKKPLKINPRALKIHNEDCYVQGETEMEINKYILDNKNKYPHINYPLTSFIYNDIYFIVVYDVAIGSLYDVMKIFDKQLPIEFVNLIIPQLIKPVEFIHKCKFIHTDIKPENYLLIGLNKLQKDIMTYSLEYNFSDKLRSISTFKKLKQSDFKDKIILDKLNKFLKLISMNFDLKNNILSDDDVDSDSDNNIDNLSVQSKQSEQSEQSFYSVISDKSNEEDYETVSSYNSRDNEYEIPIDNFHTNELIRILIKKDSYKYNKQQKISNNLIEIKKIKEKEEKQKYLLETYFLNPTVKLTDFGTMIRFGETNSTIQTRYYRAPEIILGNKFDEKIDLWSLGCTIYELITGKILFYTCKDYTINKYDVDLVNIRMLFEKIEHEQKILLLESIYKSKRKNYFINKNNCLNFFKKIDNESWVKDLENKGYLNKDNNNLSVISTYSMQIICLIKNLLNVNPLIRSIEF